MKKLFLVSLLLAASQYSFADESCFPEPVKPGVFLGDPSGGRSFMEVLEIQGCWLHAKRCSIDAEGNKECREDRVAWFHVSKIQPFKIRPQ